MDSNRKIGLLELQKRSFAVVTNFWHPIRFSLSEFTWTSRKETLQEEEVLPLLTIWGSSHLVVPGCKAVLLISQPPSPLPLPFPPPLQDPGLWAAAGAFVDFTYPFLGSAFKQYMPQLLR